MFVYVCMQAYVYVNIFRQYLLPCVNMRIGSYIQACASLSKYLCEPLIFITTHFISCSHHALVQGIQSAKSRVARSCTIVLSCWHETSTDTLQLVTLRLGIASSSCLLFLAVSEIRKERTSQRQLPAACKDTTIIRYRQMSWTSPLYSVHQNLNLTS